MRTHPINTYHVKRQTIGKHTHHSTTTSISQWVIEFSHGHHRLATPGWPTPRPLMRCWPHLPFMASPRARRPAADNRGGPTRPLSPQDPAASVNRQN